MNIESKRIFWMCKIFYKKTWRSSKILNGISSSRTIYLYLWCNGCHTLVFCKSDWFSVLKNEWRGNNQCNDLRNMPLSYFFSGSHSKSNFRLKTETIIRDRQYTLKYLHKGDVYDSIQLIILFILMSDKVSERVLFIKHDSRTSSLHYTNLFPQQK